MTKPPTYHPKLSNEEVRKLEHERTKPKCPHVWNHLPSMSICRICLDARIAAGAVKNQQYALTRAFHRALNPIISRETIKRMEAERTKIVIAFRLNGKRGKLFCLSLEPNHADIGGVFIQLFEGPVTLDKAPLASAIISTAEFAAIGALITNPEIIPHV